MNVDSLLCCDESGFTRKVSSNQDCWEEESIVCNLFLAKWSCPWNRYDLVMTPILSVIVRPDKYSRSCCFHSGKMCWSHVPFPFLLYHMTHYSPESWKIHALSITLQLWALLKGWAQKCWDKHSCSETNLLASVSQNVCGLIINHFPDRSDSQIPHFSLVLSL